MCRMDLMSANTLNSSNSSNGTNSTKSGAVRLLEAIRMQGSIEVPKALFYVICIVDALCLMAVVVLLSSCGVDFIEEHLTVCSWLIGLLFLSILVGWVAKNFLKMGLELWKMTKDD